MVKLHRHTAHSMHSRVGLSLLLTPRFRFLRSDISDVSTRKIPDEFTKEDRIAFLQIAERATQEAVNVYTIASLGMQMYVRTAEALKASE